MSSNLIRSIQKQDSDLRLIMPFGLNVTIGDVVNVNRDGSFILEGTSRVLLGLPVGKVRPPKAGSGVTYLQQSGENASLTFRAKGKASSLFPELPTANAGFDVSFASADSWILAVSNRQIASMQELGPFRQAILDAYFRDVWDPNWALVTSVATADRFTLIASNKAHTKAALSINGRFDASAAAEVKLTSGIQIAAASAKLLQTIVEQPSTPFCSALRVRSRWWTPKTGALDQNTQPAPTPQEIATASDAEFWEPIVS
jgi:hypothetical protein